MKKIIYLFSIIGLAFMSCDPIEDINNEIDAIENPVQGNTEYTLTNDDYDAFDLGFGSFNSVDQAKDSIPGLLSEMYPIWGEGSSVLVNYNLFIGSAEGVSDFTGSGVYELTNADYASTGSDAFGFYPGVNAEDEIPTVLATAITDPTEGQIVLAEYKQYTETPEVGLATIYDGAFPDVFGDFENIDLLGAQGWSEGSSYANGSGFDGANNDNEDWLISPEVDLAGQSNLQFQINQRISFLGAGVLTEHVNILVATDYDGMGDPSMATWDVITLNNIPDGSNSDFVLSEAYDFSAYEDETVHVAFKFQSTTVTSPLWRVDFFTIKALGVEGDRDSRGSYFAYEGGSWEVSDGVYYLSMADYDSMGEESGQPGRFDNFSSSTPADNYLPTFLNIKYPFAQEEDELFVIYKYFSGNSGLGTRGNLYTVINGEWVGHQSTIESSLQFGYKDGLWVPDNTIRLTLGGPDYAYMSGQLINEPGFEGPAENMGNFGSFDVRETSGNYWNPEMLLVAFDILMDNLDPSAEEGQKYVLTYKIYDGSVGDRDISLIKEGGEWIVNTEG